MLNYKILVTADPDDMQTEVWGHQVDGWRLHGGVSVTMIEHPGDPNSIDRLEYSFAQAMVKDA